MRPRQFWVYMSIYITTLLLIFLINYSGYKTGEMYSFLQELLKSVFYQVLLIQIITLWIWGTFNSGSAIGEEVNERTYDFFRMLPMTPRAKTIGVLIGKNLVVLLMAFFNFVLMLAIGLAADLNKVLLGQMVLVLLCGAILANSMTLLSSINPKGRRKKSAIGGFVVLAFILGPVIINGVVELAKAKNVENLMVWFFEFKLPVMIMVSIIALYLSCWTIKGILRKFTREDEPLFTRAGAYLFMFGFELVVIGSFYHYLFKLNESYELERKAINFAFWMVSFAPVLAIPLGSVRTIDKYLEFTGIRLSRTGGKMRLAQLIMFSNLSLGLGLFAIWAALATTTTIITRLPLTDYIVYIGAILSFYVFLLLLLEVFVVISPTVGKIGILLVFIIGIYSVLPIILAGIFDASFLSPHSPFGYAIYLLDQNQELETHFRVAAFNVLLCITPAVIIFRRHAYVISARKQM